jgi:iron complex outermembrane receptor protein
MHSTCSHLNCKPFVAAISTALGILSASAAQAQLVPGPVEPVAAPAVDAETGGIAEVIVTAQKRREQASRVPSAISVLGAAQLESQHVSQLADLAGYLPSVQIVTGGSPGQTQISVRGIPTLGPGAVVGTYLDDTPLGSSNNFSSASMFVLDLLPYDVARIELLRGPQGTLYGASAMGGLLKYVTNDPDLDTLSGRVGMGASALSGADGNGWETRGVINVPLIKDTLAVRATLANTHTPGYVNNALNGQLGINRVQQQYGRVAALWRVSNTVNVKMSALRQKIDAKDNSVLLLSPSTLTPVFGQQTTSKNVSEAFGKTLDYASASVNADLGWADFTSASSYSKTTTRLVTDLTQQFGIAFPMLGNFAPGISAFPLDLDLRKFTQELRLSSKSGKDVEWQINAFYAREKSGNRQLGTATTMDGVPLAGIDPLLVVSLPSEYREQALYGQVSYKLTEKFNLTGGLRYAKNKQNYDQIVSAGILLPLGVSHGDSSENVVTYLFSPRYFLSADTMIYGRIASGYRPGGPNVRIPGVPLVVDADSLVNYEIGMKSSFLNKRASIELAVYQINWRDIQLRAVSASGVGYLANAGTAKSRGIELTANLRPIPSLRLGFNTAYTNARLTEDAPAVAGLRGDTIQGIPNLTWSLTTDYYIGQVGAWAASVGGGYSWTGERNSGQSSDPLSHRLPAYGLLNLNAEFSRDTWTARLYAKNLANNRSNTMLTNVQNAVTREVVYVAAVRPQPRTVGVELDVAF